MLPCIQASITHDRGSLMSMFTACIMKSVQGLVKEFLTNEDENEAARCWRELDVSFYGHQLVFTILLAAFEFPQKTDLLMQLIHRFAQSGEVTQVWHSTVQSSIQVELWPGLFYSKAFHSQCILVCMRRVYWASEGGASSANRSRSFHCWTLILRGCPFQIIERLTTCVGTMQTQIQKGFERVEASLSDLKLDYPSGPQEFAACRNVAEKSGWLKPDPTFWSHIYLTTAAACFQFFTTTALFVSLVNVEQKVKRESYIFKKSWFWTGKIVESSSC